MTDTLSQLSTPDPCPFCGADQAAISKFTGDDTENIPDTFIVGCTDCGASGPIEASEFAAVLQWNSAPRKLPAST